MSDVTEIQYPGVFHGCRTIHANQKHFLSGSRSYSSSLNPSAVENQSFYLNYTTYRVSGTFSVPPTIHGKSQSRLSGPQRSLVMRVTKRPCSISQRKDQSMNNATIDLFQTNSLKNHTGATLIPSFHCLVPQSGTPQMRLQSRFRPNYLVVTKSIDKIRN